MKPNSAIYIRPVSLLFIISRWDPLLHQDSSSTLRPSFFVLCWVHKIINLFPNTLFSSFAMSKLLPLNGGEYYLWEYVPSTAASVIAAIVWLMVSALLFWRMLRTQSWFCSAFIIGSFSKYTLAFF
jgi:hypothetical protein